MATQHGQRLVFNNAKSLVANAGFNVGSAVLSQSYLRSEVLLTTTQTSYHIPVLVNDTQNGAASGFPTEQRLQLQDAFVVSSIGIFTAVPANAADTAYQLYSYPDLTAFGANAGAYYGLYNGQFQWIVNNRQIIPTYDLYRHYWVPQTQTSATLVNQWDSEAGYFPAEPNPVLVGSKNNQISIVLPSALTAVTANSRLIVIFRGMLAQNVTPVR